jgi:hypothetical protein
MTTLFKAGDEVEVCADNGIWFDGAVVQDQHPDSLLVPVRVQNTTYAVPLDRLRFKGYRAARGAFNWEVGDERAEASVARVRGENPAQRVVDELRDALEAEHSLRVEIEQQRDELAVAARAYIDAERSAATRQFWVGDYNEGAASAAGSRREQLEAVLTRIQVEQEGGAL